MKKRTAKKIDKTLLIAVIILLVIGVVLVHSSSILEGARKHDDSLYFVKKQIVFGVLGLILLIGASMIDYRIYRYLSIPILILTLILNGLLYTDMGRNYHGSTRWLVVFGFSLMPSELIKISGPLFIGTILDKMDQLIKRKGQFIFVIVCIGIITGVVFFKDMGSAIVIGGLMMAMVIASGARLSWTGLTTLGVGVIAYFALKYITRFQYRWERIVGFLHPFSPEYDNYQLINTLYAVAMGGLTGGGLGQGVQKFGFVPNVFSDSIFSVAGEELGLIGAGIIVVLFFIVIYRGFIISSNARDRFDQLLAIGLTCSIGIQAMLHIMVNVGMAPITGITLPFISYGGTSILVSMIQVGILLNISKRGI